MERGLFISLEGPDGSGKSTQAKRLIEHLEKLGYEVLLTREPGGTSISEKIRTILLDKENTEMTEMTEALLYAASRAQHVAQVIRPAVEEGKVVICDRFIDSSIAYQGYGRNLGDKVRIINEYAVEGCMPDLTILFKMDPSFGTGRIADGAKDRLELEAVDFHQRVFGGYLELEKRYSERICGVDAARSIEEISKDVCSIVDEKLAAMKRKTK